MTGATGDRSQSYENIRKGKGKGRGVRGGESGVGSPPNRVTNKTDGPC